MIFYYIVHFVGYFIKNLKINARIDESSVGTLERNAAIYFKAANANYFATFW
jgi:hypothetical protein